MRRSGLEDELGLDAELAVLADAGRRATAGLELPGIHLDLQAVAAVVVVQPDAQLPKVNMAQYGNPLGVIGPPSNGPGSGGGIGTGKGGGVGSGDVLVLCGGGWDLHGGCLVDVGEQSVFAGAVRGV